MEIVTVTKTCEDPDSRKKYNTDILVLKKKYHTVGTVLKSNWKNRSNRGKIDTPSTYIHDHSLSWLGTGNISNKWQG